MAERIQLKDPGSEFVMTVAKVNSETVENSEYWLFTNGNKELLVPKTSVASQLERLDISSATGLLGVTVKFSRSSKLNKYGKPFWNLDLATEAERSGASAPSVGAVPQSASPASADSSEKPRLDRIYIRATKLILDEAVPLYTKAGIGCTDTAVAAMVATLFIAASKVEAQ